MTWYAIYTDATGRLESIGTVVAAPLSAGLTAKDCGPNRPEGIWNPQTLDFEPVQSWMVRQVPQLDFVLLFTQTERIAIDNSSDEEVQDARRVMYLVDPVDRDNQGVIDAVNSFETKGLIGQGRANEILDPPPQSRSA